MSQDKPLTVEMQITPQMVADAIAEYMQRHSGVTVKTVCPDITVTGFNRLVTTYNGFTATVEMPKKGNSNA